FAEFAGIEGMDAVIHGTIRVDGPAAGPGLHTALTLSLQSVTARLATRPAGDQVRVDLELAADQGRNFTVQGTVPNRLSLLRNPPPRVREREALSLAIRSGGFPLDWMTPFLEGFGVDRLAGLLQADARIEGTVASPRASGTMGLAEGRIRMPERGIDYRAMAGRLSLSGNRLQVESWRAEADGSAQMDGNLLLAPLDDPRLDLRIRLDGFRAIRNEYVRLGLNGEAAVTGTLSAPRLSGRLTLEKTDVFADRVGQNPSVRPVTLTDRDYQMLESYFGYRPGSVREKGDLLLPWAVDLDVRVGGDVWLRKEVRPEVRVLLTGSLEVRKEAGDSLQLFGTVEAIPTRSIIEQFGKRFAIEEGRITFNGPISSWRADIGARYEVPAYKDPGSAEVAITLNVQGGADNLRLTLGSEPAMETSDIVSYLATGRPSRSAADFGRGDGSGGLSAQSSAFALGALTDVIEDEAGQQIGLDVMEIRQDPAEGTLVIAGRYVSPRLYVGFQQPVTRGKGEDGLDDQQQGTQVELEYSLYRWLLLNLQGGSEFRWFFRTRYAF
ncbi:MAG TPA: translocation/assembly module TamB domain-containing protein, partial [Gemmatimonadales bacterium]|nr:translocation/assembly module TamB domain-containing protein [Gemmatimonadales bacterium]